MSLPPTFPWPAPIQTLYWIRRPTQYLDACRRRFGPTFRMNLLQLDLAVFSDPESVRTIFAAKSSVMRAGEVNRILRVVVGESSVLLLDDDEHMRHRKLLLPSFHGERMRLYGETMAEITRGVMARWPEDREFSLHPHTQDITLQIILETVFGAEGKTLDRLKAQFVKLLSFAEYRSAFALMLYLSARPELEERQPWKWMLRGLEATNALLYEQIANRRSERRAEARTDVFSMLMTARDEDGRPLDDRELRDELFTALSAGHETTATALAWAFERILSHPPVYERLRDELDAAGGTTASPEKIAALPYLDATIKEVFRLRPVVPMVARRLQQPMALGGYDLPAGTAVGACIYLAHRNPDVYPEPLAFRPERFLGVPADPVTWFPFGGGIRRCIGAQFALYEMKIVLATMLAACHFELAQPAPARILRRAVTLWPEGGTRVKIRRLARGVRPRAAAE